MARDDVRFFCDAMLGGLARWLRAAGHDAEFEAGIDDAELVARAMRSGRVVLSSDGGLFERALVRDGKVAGLFVPRHADKIDQLAFVLGAFELEVGEPRCMPCGGRLVAVLRDQARAEAPPRTFESGAAFWRCERCARLLWRGSHWSRIAPRLARAAACSRLVAGAAASSAGRRV